MDGASTCCVCGGRVLVDHLTVGREIGADGLIPTTDRYGSALDDIVRCLACGHMQLTRLPSEAELEGAYAAAASMDYVAESAGQRETARRALARIEAHAQVDSLVDLGCWVGFLVAEAAGRGWDAVGVEPSAFASEYARTQLGLDVRTDDLLTAPLPAGGFTAVTMGDVIEHLPRPAAALERVRDLLAPGGVLWLALPDAGSAMARAMGRRWWSVLPTHVQYFTRSSLGSLLRRGGFDVLEVGTQPKVFSVRYYLSRLRGYSGSAADVLVGAARAGGVADRLWALDLRDRMYMIARAR